MTRLRLQAALLLLALPMACGPAYAGDPAEGRGIAERWCSSCHVAPGHGGGTDAVPTLEGIARDPRHDAGWLRQWLNDPHPPMPNLQLSHAEIENVVAYLQTLVR
jgi:mono/diheme cytochrome c family protein